MTLTADRSSDVGSAACTCNTPIWPVLVIFGDFACLPFMASNDFGFDFDFFSSAYFFFVTAAHAKHANLFTLLRALN